MRKPIAELTEKIALKEAELQALISTRTWRAIEEQHGMNMANAAAVHCSDLLIELARHVAGCEADVDSADCDLQLMHA